MSTRNWQSRHGLSGAEFQALFDSLTSQGYRLVDLSGYTSNDKVLFTCLFEQFTGPAWYAYFGMTSAEYQVKFDDLTSKGYVLTLVNGYTLPDGSDRYIGIFQKIANPPSWIARHGMDSQTYQSEYNKWVGAAGFNIKHVSGYTSAGQVRYAAIWDKSPRGEIKARHGLTAENYQSEYDTLNLLGFRLVHVSGYGVHSIAYYAGIWEKSGSNTPLSARHGLTAREYQSVSTNNYYQGYRLRRVSAYTINHSERFAAIWENPNMSRHDLDTINSKIVSLMSEKDIPAFSMAITQNEKLVFAKAFGYSDKSIKETANPDSLFRIASISKFVTSLAVNSLIDEGKFTLDSKVFGEGPLLGLKYGTRPYSEWYKAVTVKQLLNHTAGVPKNFNDGSTADELVSNMLDSMPVRYRPGTAYDYNNTDYVVLGRIVEAKSGMSYGNYVRDVVLRKAGITDMQIAGPTVADRKPNEVLYYGAGSYPSIPFERDQPAGSWIARPIDLVAILSRADKWPVRPDNLLSTESLKALYTPSHAPAATPGGNTGDTYGLGWIVFPTWQGHNGGLSGTMSFLVRRNDGYTYAFVTNNDFPDRDTWWIKKNIMDPICDASIVWPQLDFFPASISG
ncbi:beta-lactamase [Thelonectria olida]|uniref:Beta-lactamase n=1 Tax=Thelonectria olida TaxID=1576542 RepID=A0A9P8VXL3_9HYPO|nr:beta-lactamase [Thelonectria olida]